MPLRSICYADIVTAATRIASILVPSGNYIVDTNGGSTAAVRHVFSTYYISLPSYPAAAFLPRSEADFVLGTLVHELLHVRYTDWNAIPKINTPELLKLGNALEDIRIEKAGMKSGQPPNGAKLLAEVTETLALRAISQGANWSRYAKADALAYGVVVAGRLANPDYGPLPATTAYSKVIPAWTASLLTRFMPAILTTTDTADVYRLAYAMLASLPADQPADQDDGNHLGGFPGRPQDDAQEPQDGQDGQDGQEGIPTPPKPEKPASDDPSPTGTDGNPIPTDAGQDYDQDADDQDYSEAGDQDGEAGDDQDGDQDGETGGDQPGETSDKGGTGQAQDQPTDTPEPAPVLDPTEALRDIIESHTQGQSLDNTYAATIAKWEQARHETDTRNAHARTDLHAAKAHRTSSSTAALAPKVRQMLHSQDDSLTSRYETRGRLDRKALGRIGTGDPRVFTRKTATDGIKTGVTFLTDMSGSMGGPRAIAQAQSVIALGDACVRAGADVAIFGFGPDARGMSRAGVLLPFKNWNESMDLGASRLCGHVSHYGTNLCPSLIAAAKDLAQRPHLDKRILFVMTDGDCQYGRDKLRETAAYAAARYDLIVVGIGIQIDVSDAFPHSAIVNDVRTLATDTMKALLKVVG